MNLILNTSNHSPCCVMLTTKQATDISLEWVTLNEQILDFAEFLAPINIQALAMLGGYYPNTDTNQYFAILSIFDRYVCDLYSNVV